MTQESGAMARVADVWNGAKTTLDIELIAPFTADLIAERVECVAFLPHFGGPKGMVVGAIWAPDFRTDGRLVRYARARGLYVSFVNHASFDGSGLEPMREALCDWGYFGPPDLKPAWIATPQ